MSKRDATPLGAEEEKEERGAKQPRYSREEAKDVTTAAAAAASASSSSAPASSSSASSSSSLFSSSAASGTSKKSKKKKKSARKQVRAHTHQLVQAIRGGKKLALSQRMQATCALLKEDSERTESMLNMSMQAKGSEDEPVSAFFHLLRLFAETAVRTSDDAATIKRKNEARQLFKETLAPMLPRLRSFDPATIDASTGNNALHDLLSRMTPEWHGAFSHQLAEALIQHGVPLEGRNKRRRTVALSHAFGLHSASKSSCGFRLLLQYGADLNASDADGNTPLHHLISNEVWPVLKDLCAPAEEGLACVTHFDLFVRNHSGQDPVCLSRVSWLNVGSPNKWQIYDFMRAQLAKWRSHTRLVVLGALSEPLIPDLAELVLGYVDGSGRASDAAAAAAK